MLLLIISDPPRGAAAQSAEEIAAVEAASQAFYDALAVIDDGTAMAGVAAPKRYITFTSPFGKEIHVGYEAWQAYWPNSNKRFKERTVSLTGRQLHVNGNLAWEMGYETGKVIFTDGREAPVDFIVTNVFEKIDGRWLMVSHHVQPKPQ